ncbi:MAG: hypothetical protein ABIM60_02500 [candidate division WOR-3 bacterium]
MEKIKPIEQKEKKISNKWLIFISIILLSILPLFFLMGAFGIKMVKIYEPESIKK